MRTTSIPALRRLAVTAQSYPSRFRRADADDVEAAIRRAMCIQLDTVTAVERSHRIAIASRVGLYPRDTVSALMREGRIIEGWAHALCLLPAEDWPLYAWSRASMQDGVPWHGDVKKRYPGLADRILGEIRERGALGSKDFAGQGRPRAAPGRDVVGGDVELEAREADARRAVRVRGARDRRPRELPSPVRPARTRPSPHGSRRAGPFAGGGDQGADRAGRPGPGRPAASPRSPSTFGRSGTSSSEARRSRVRMSTRSSPRGSSSGSQSTTARRRSSSRPESSSTDRARTPPFSCRRSTTSSGVTSTRRASSGSST